MEKRIRPFGTGPGIFGASGHVLSVLLVAPGRAGVLDFRYENEQRALEALDGLQSNLDSDEYCAKTLRNEYSIDHLFEYLQKYLLRSGLEHIEHMAEVEVDRVNGLRRKVDGGKYAPLNLEQLVPDAQDADWDKVCKVSGKATTHGEFAMKRLSLDRKFRYTAWTGIIQTPDLIPNCDEKDAEEL